MILMSPLSRIEILPYLPQDATAAELGVWEGNFSVQIISKNKPKKLHLIDPWGEHGEEYIQTYKIQKSVDEALKKTISRVKSGLQDGSVEIHKDYSHNVLPRFQEGELDWIYIDGMHTYEAVKKDLELADKVVREDGFIVGHDFSYIKNRENFGVIPAVQEFLKDHADYKLVLFTMEVAPTFVIAKSPDSSETQRFIESIIEADRRAVWIESSLLNKFEQVPHQEKGKKEHMFLNLVYKFMPRMVLQKICLKVRRSFIMSFLLRAPTLPFYPTRMPSLDG